MTALINVPAGIKLNYILSLEQMFWPALMLSILLLVAWLGEKHKK